METLGSTEYTICGFNFSCRDRVAFRKNHCIVTVCLTKLIMMRTECVCVCVCLCISCGGGIFIVWEEGKVNERVTVVGICHGCVLSWLK